MKKAKLGKVSILELVQSAECNWLLYKDNYGYLENLGTLY